MKNGVAPPRTPGLRHRFGFFRAHASEMFAKGDILFRKRIRPAQGSQGNIVRRPLSDARHRHEALDGRLRTGSGLELDGSRIESARQRDNALGPRADDSELGDLGDGGPGDVLGQGCQPAQFRKRRCDGLAEGFGKTAADGGGGFDGDLLAQDCPNGHFKPIKGSRDPEARVRPDAGPQQWVLSQMARDEIGSGREIE